MTHLLSPDEFGQLFADVQESALRLELQPVYMEPGEADSVAAFLAGRPGDPMGLEGAQFWFDLVRGLVDRGGRMERVRVQENPPTGYQRWERWLDLGLNRPAGEVIRYMTRTRAYKVGLLSAAGNVDWWLIDGHQLVRMFFDNIGRRVRTEVTSDPAAIAQASHWWDLAVRNSAVLPEVHHDQTC